MEVHTPVNKASLRPVISRGNSKIGKIPNFSLAPLKTCSKEACATCGKACYANKSYRVRPTVRNAWDTNTALARNNIPVLEKSIAAHLRKTKPDLFRVHVGGDFVTKSYAEMWNRIAKQFKGTKFLAFTKRWDFIEQMEAEGNAVSSNMRVIYSAWPGMPTPPATRPIAWMDDGTDERIPKNAHVCKGGKNGVTCKTCRKCWNLRTRDVVFKKH